MDVGADVRAVAVEPAVEDRPRLAIADRAERRQARIESLAQGLRLIDQPGVELGAGTPADPGEMGRPIDVSFQSRFGRAIWLEPATDKVLAAYPAQGVKKIAIAAPGFAADCIETIEELGIRAHPTHCKRAVHRGERVGGDVPD